MDGEASLPPDFRFDGDSIWTPALVTELARLWNEGVATSEIGRRLGVTKSAAVGKARRLGLEARPNPVDHDKAAAAKDRAAEAAELFFAHRNTRHAAAGGFTAAPLTGGCRFIIVPDFLERIAAHDLAIYCGKGRRPGSSYCDEHHMRCWQKPEDARAVRALERAELQERPRW